MKTLLFQNTKKASSITPAQRTSLCLVLTIILSCLLVALAQGSGFFYSTHYTKVLILTLLFLAYAGAFFYLKGGF